MIPDNVRNAISVCLKFNIPFSAYAMPEETTIKFLASTATTTPPSIGDISEDGFLISMFDTSYSHGVFIADELSLEDLTCNDTHLKIGREPIIHTIAHSTPFYVYAPQIEHISAHHRADGGKTVISRLISVNSEVSPIDVANAYFRQHPHCFRTIYFTPDTGLWIVATPEILIDYSTTDKRLRTMSLAGTRLKNSGGRWDIKNEKEHDLVTQHIVEILRSEGMDVSLSAPTELAFGNIEHLCHHITATGNLTGKTIDRLNPTPAVGGWPTADAGLRISKEEEHPRYCYGGYIGTIRKDCVQLYVNLRCAMAEDCHNGLWRYNLYGGGGINSMSDPTSEWNEAGFKMASLLNIINPEQ